MGEAGWTFADGPSVRMSLAIATADLREAGVDNPRLDAELLLADALHSTRTSLHMEPGAGSYRPRRERPLRRARRPAAARASRSPTSAARGASVTSTSPSTARVLVPRPVGEAARRGRARPAARRARARRRHRQRRGRAGARARAARSGRRGDRPQRRRAGGRARQRRDAAGSSRPSCRGTCWSGVEGEVRRDPLQPAVRPRRRPASSSSRRSAVHEPGAGACSPAATASTCSAGSRGPRPLRAPFVAFEVGAGQAHAVGGAAGRERPGVGRVEAHRDLAGIERVVVGER